MLSGWYVIFAFTTGCLSENKDCVIVFVSASTSCDEYMLLQSSIIIHMEVVEVYQYTFAAVSPNHPISRAFAFKQLLAISTKKCKFILWQIC